MDATEIVERIMTQHWEMTPGPASCGCWVCEEGRGAGLWARDFYLGIAGDPRPVVRVDLNSKV